MSLIAKPVIKKDPEVILKERKLQLQKTLILQYMFENFGYKGSLNFSSGNGKLFLDFYSTSSTNKYWYSLSNEDLIIMEYTGVIIEVYKTPGLSDDEYFNMMLIHDLSPIVRLENSTKLVSFIQNVALPSAEALQYHP